MAKKKKGHSAQQHQNAPAQQTAPSSHIPPAASTETPTTTSADATGGGPVLQAQTNNSANEANLVKSTQSDALNEAPAKSREEVMAEREAKKAAKAQKKSGGGKKTAKDSESNSSGKAAGGDKRIEPVASASTAAAKAEPEKAVQKHDLSDTEHLSKPSLPNEILQLRDSFMQDDCFYDSDDMCKQTIDACIHVLNSVSEDPDVDVSVAAWISGLYQKPLAEPTGVTNLVRQLRQVLSSADSSDNLKLLAIDFLDSFKETIDLATKSIGLQLRERFLHNPGASVLLFGRGRMLSAVLSIAVSGCSAMPSVILVNSVPVANAARLLAAIKESCDGISTITYVSLAGVQHVIEYARLVIIEADTVMANGSIVAPIGANSLCLAAQARSIPVLVIAQTYKLSDRVTPNTTSASAEVVPASFIAGVVCELRTLPASSVPAVVRVKQGAGITT